MTKQKVDSLTFLRLESAISNLTQVVQELETRDDLPYDVAMAFDDVDVNNLQKLYDELEKFNYEGDSV